jgi:hypothetical protein
MRADSSSRNPRHHAEQLVILVAVAAVREKKLRHQEQKCSPPDKRSDKFTRPIPFALHRGSARGIQGRRKIVHWVLQADSGSPSTMQYRHGSACRQ